MKTIKNIVFLAIAILNVNAQEKKIKFSNGTLKICSSKNFQIEGYDGNEVIIKSLHEKRNSNLRYVVRNNLSRTTSYSNFKKGKLAKVKGSKSFPRIKNDSVYVSNISLFNNDGKRKEGLKKLGKKNENSDLGIYFTIEKNGDELLFKDNNEGQLVMMGNERYLIKIPNSIKLNWQTNSCEEKEITRKQYMFFNSKASSLSNFEGEVAISSTLNNTKLVDVTGPVSINTIGGNVTIEFRKNTPQKLYSIYSNNGFIDITLPENSDIKLDATANDIFSDINFNVEEEKEHNNLQNMKLKLKSGKVKMKLNAGLGNIYIRKL